MKNVRAFIALLAITMIVTIQALRVSAQAEATQAEAAPRVLGEISVDPEISYSGDYAVLWPAGSLFFVNTAPGAYQHRVKTCRKQHCSDWQIGADLIVRDSILPESFSPRPQHASGDDETYAVTCGTARDTTYLFQRRSVTSHWALEVTSAQAAKLIPVKACGVGANEDSDSANLVRCVQCQ